MTIVDLDHDFDTVRRIAAEHLPGALVRDLGDGRSRVASKALDDLGDAELQSLVSTYGIRVTNIRRTPQASSSSTPQGAA